MLELQKEYHKARMDRDKELYERQIKIVDASIHNSEATNEYLAPLEEEEGRVERLFLPTYAPKYN